jgi:hypothetical protein
MYELRTPESSTSGFYIILLCNSIELFSANWLSGMPDNTKRPRMRLRCEFEKIGNLISAAIPTINAVHCFRKSILHVVAQYLLIADVKI